MGRAELAERLVRASPELEVLSPAGSASAASGAILDGMEDPAHLDQLNQRVLERVNRNGRFFLSTTRLRGPLASGSAPAGGARKRRTSGRW